MRYKSLNGKLRLFAIAGTRAIMMALDIDKDLRQGLRGFAFWRETPGVPGSEQKWLRSSKVFKSVDPEPKKKVNGKYKIFRTNEHPIQSFLWSDYGAEPSTIYRFRIVPMYGNPGALQPDDANALAFDIKTEREDDGRHGIWFNRGAIASQYFAREFKNAKPTPEQLSDPQNEMTRWLSRGLLEACKAFIDNTPAGDGLQACVYEFTYSPILDALKAALDRGVKARIIFHKTAANDAAILKAGIPQKFAGERILHPRTKPQIPHNKFIVRSNGNDEPQSVWSGSTNITDSGFLGQSNVGHLIHDAATAQKYQEYWLALTNDPTLKPTVEASLAISPHPHELVLGDTITTVFSPRDNEAMLFWYGNRMFDAESNVCFTAAFDVSKRLRRPLAFPRNYLRFVMMEQPPTSELKRDFGKDRHLLRSYGAVLGQNRIRIYPADGKPGGVKSKAIPNFELEKWFWREEHTREKGNIFFIHTKYMLIDPLTDDPIVCTGSANFSKNSLVANDENMVLIRGETRVSDIYLTEFDRLFRHFFFRDVANETAGKGEAKAEKGAFLEEKPGVDWTERHFNPKSSKCWRREMFFVAPAGKWATKAGARMQDESVHQGIAAEAEDKAAAKKKRAAKKAAAKKQPKPRKAAKKEARKSVKKKAAKRR